MYCENLKSGRVRFVMQFTEERTGERRRVSVTMPRATDKCRREAERVLNDRIRAINAGIAVSDETLREAWDAYLADKARHWRPSTYRRNAYAGAALCDLLDGRTLISKLSARWVSDRFAASGKDVTTLNELLNRFKGFVNWCWQTERLQNVSWSRRLLPYPEPTAKEKNALKYLERDELVRLLPELKIDIDRFLIHFLALSGLRIGEALALRQEDVDLDARLIRVDKTVDHASGVVLPGAKTMSSVRDVYIQDELLDLCRAIRKYNRRMSVACGFRTDLFFCDLDGRPLQYARINKYFAENTQRVIGRRLTLHSLRHTHASLMFEGGASLEAVSLRLGHSDSRTTRDIYLHVTERLKERYNRDFDRIHILQ